MEQVRSGTEIEHRQAQRESRFLVADLRVEGDGVEHRVKIRNLSSRGVMAEGQVRVASGSRVDLRLEVADWIEGVVAWIEGTRFGIAFAEDVVLPGATAQTAGRSTAQ